MGTVRFPLEVVLSAIDRVTAPVVKVQKKIDRVFAPVKRVQNALQGLYAASGIDKLAGGFSRLGSGVANVASEATAFVAKIGGLAAAAGGAVYAAVLGFAKSGESIATSADRIGIGIEAYQELRFAADQSNVSTEDLDIGLLQLQKRLGLVAQGNKGAAIGFERLGIKVYDAGGKLRDASELFPEIADRMNRVEAPAKRVALATQIFGKSGANLIPMLREGSSGLDAMRVEARRLGIVMSGEAARSGDAFLDSQNRLFAALTGVRNLIGSALLPVFSDLIAKVTEFVVVNRPAIQAFAKEFAAQLPARLMQLRDLFVELREKLAPLIAVGAFVVDHFGAVNTILTILAVVIGAKLIVAIFALIPAIYALGVAILTTPVGWILLAIAAIVAAGVFLWTHWEAIGGFFVKLWGWIRDAFVAGVTWVWENARWLLGPVGLIVEHWDTIRAFFGRMWDGVKTIFSGAWSFLQGWWKLFIAPVAMIIEKWGVIREFFTGLWDGVKAQFQGVLSFIMEKVVGLVDVLPDWLKSTLGLNVQASGPVAVSPSLERTARQAGPAASSSSAAVRVEFANLPKGARVATVKNDGTDLDLSMGYAMVTP